MACSTRWSRTPLRRSCSSTICARSIATGSVFGLAAICALMLVLTPALPDLHLKSYNAVLVPHPNNRYTPVHIVLKLDDLLGRLRQVRNVSQSNIAGNLLFDSNSGIWIVFRPT